MHCLPQQPHSRQSPRGPAGAPMVLPTSGPCWDAPPLSGPEPPMCAPNTSPPGIPTWSFSWDLFFYILLVMGAYFCYVTSLDSRAFLRSRWDQVQIISLTVISKQCWQAWCQLPSDSSALWLQSNVALISIFHFLTSGQCQARTLAKQLRSILGLLESTLTAQS